MKKTFSDLPAWEFELHEQSQGVYKMTGRSFLGQEVAATGIDPDALIERIRADAMHVSSQVPRLNEPMDIS